ncbi:DUF4097 domain-containing protein [Paenibacillus sp. SC116]|uniref:DUF4097 domain-containing protein n=1 Tax=Paenibacillus sp. SC116 TaxID=2968986 RepID=UPI00215ABA87|nr:DUF4097 domain-containing protein [Paenibacillus sp. SC116]MCR8846040.1 DUF4097 domain-containing protein [Paenibacillus sp. SC116]
MKNALLVISLVLIVIIGSACSVLGEAGHSFKIEQSFQVGSIQAIDINNESWDIEFKSTDSNQITITAEGKQKDEKNDPVVIKEDTNKILITQKNHKAGFMDNFKFGKEGTISISIPRHSVDTITVDNRFGDMEWNDIALHTVDISTETGSMMVKGLTADIGKVTSENGPLGMRDSSVRELTATSTTGDSDMTNVTSSSMKITSTNGAISIKDANESESVVVQTKLGDIAVSFKEAPTSLSVSASSHLSDITVQLDGFKESVSTEQSKTGVIGKGQNKLELASEMGTIDVR